MSIYIFYKMYVYTDKVIQIRKFPIISRVLIYIVEYIMSAVISAPFTINLQAFVFFQRTTIMGFNGLYYMFR